MTGALVALAVILCLLVAVLLKQWLDYQRVLKGRDQVWGNGTPRGGPRVDRQSPVDRERVKDTFR